MRFAVGSSASVIGSAVVAVVVGCSGVGSPSATAPASSPPVVPAQAAGTAFPDFDGDARADLVHGVGSTRGEVVVAYGSGTTTSFSRTDAGGIDPSPDNTMGFGQGLLARDLNADRFTDLVVVDQAQGGAGSAIYLVFGSASGLQTSAARRYGVPGGLFGFRGTPALVEEPGRLLAVGASAPASVAQGGAFVAYPLGSDGLPDADPVILSQQNLPGADEPGDAFGSALAADRDLLLVGAPGEDVGRAADAGAVTVLRSRGGVGFTGSVLTQDSPGVAGRAEAGDRFGTVVAVADGYAAVGVPAEDDAVPDAGAVATFTVAQGRLTPLATLTQETKGVPGVSEPGDRFGSAVAVIRGCPKAASLLVGAPGEAVGATFDAGAAWVLPLSTACPTRLRVAEGRGPGGAATEMASIGSAVSVLREADTAADTIVLTAPGVSEEGVYGRVLTLPPPYAGDPAVVAADLHLNEEGTIALSPPAG
ncbi:MAG: hypothetical protein WAL91_04480 [Propionicimonas sp.]